MEDVFAILFNITSVEPFTLVMIDIFKITIETCLEMAFEINSVDHSYMMVCTPDISVTPSVVH